MVLCTQQNEYNSDNNDDCSNERMGHDNKIPLEDIKPITLKLKQKVVARIVWNKIGSAKI